jgi:hypothetical protein
MLVAVPQTQALLQRLLYWPLEDLCHSPRRLLVLLPLQ